MMSPSGGDASIMGRRILIAVVLLGLVVAGALGWGALGTRGGVEGGRLVVPSAGTTGHHGAGSGDTADLVAGREPVAQLEATSVNLRNAEGLLLRVLDEGLVPLPDLDVVLGRRGLLLGRGLTDQRGMAQFEAAHGKVECYVRSLKVVIWSGSLEGSGATSQMTDIVIPDRCKVDGQLVLDGVPLSESLDLALVFSDRSATSCRLPAELSAQLGESADEPLRFRRESNNSAFAFRWLECTWQGKLVIDQRMPTLALPGNEFTLASPALGLVVSLKHRPAITGRTFANGAAIGNVEWLAKETVIQWSEEKQLEVITGVWTQKGRSDAQGYFRVAFPTYSGTFADVQLAFSKSPSLARAIDLRGLDIGRDFALGEVGLAVAQDLVFIISDSGGNPIRGAVAECYLPKRLRSLPTSDDGRGLLSGVLPQSTRYAFSALRYGTRELDLAANPGEPVRVVLERLSALEVQVRDRDGAPVGELNVVIDCASEMPFGSGKLADERQVALGATEPSSYNYAQGRATIELPVDSLGWAMASGLVPEIPMSISVADQYGNEVCSEERLVLGLGEWRRVDRRVNSSAHVFYGHVSMPPPYSRVRVAASMDSVRWKELDCDGAVFCVRNLYAPRVLLRIESDGCTPVTTWVEGFTDGATLEFKLESE
jgi:hypothetical protein